VKSGIPDYRKDTGRDAVSRILPRVTVALLGLVLAVAGGVFEAPAASLYSSLICGFVLVFLGVQGFWLPYVRAVQLAIAAWLPVSCLVFHLRGPALGFTLGVAAALAVISLRERPVHE